MEPRDTDIGDAVRSEPNNAIPNTVAVWGDTGPAQANASCASAAGSQSCGDPGGCQASAFTGSRVACFAIRSCTLSGTDLGTCTAYGAWGSRPISSAPGTRAIQVVVVYRFTPQTPLSSQVLPLTGGFFRLQQSAIGSQLYF